MTSPVEREGRMDGAATPPIDIFRARWRRVRQALGLLDPADDEFGEGGLSSLIPDRTSRLLITPADPELSVIEFDESLWEWWGRDFDDPATGGRTRWGPDKRPTANAAVYGSDYGDEQWRRYIALHRSGALEVGLGRDGSFARDEQRYFFLSSIVARSWAAFHRYEEVVSKFGLSGPFEVLLALCETKDALLGGVAEGWAEPGTAWNDGTTCRETHVLLRREVPDWPADGEAFKDLAFSLGAQIEDAWSVQQRRFLAHRGEHAGSFDPTAARWH